MNDKLDVLIVMLDANMRLNLQILACLADAKTFEQWKNAYEKMHKVLKEGVGKDEK